MKRKESGLGGGQGDEDTATKYSRIYPDCYLITPSESGTVTEDLPH